MLVFLQGQIRDLNNSPVFLLLVLRQSCDDRFPLAHLGRHGHSVHRIGSAYRFPQGFWMVIVTSNKGKLGGRLPILRVYGSLIRISKGNGLDKPYFDIHGSTTAPFPMLKFPSKTLGTVLIAVRLGKQFSCPKSVA